MRESCVKVSMSFKTVRLFNVFNAPITFINSQHNFNFKDRNIESRKKSKIKFSIAVLITKFTNFHNQNSSEFYSTCRRRGSIYPWTNKQDLVRYLNQYHWIDTYKTTFLLIICKSNAVSVSWAVDDGQHASRFSLKCMIMVALWKP